MIAILAILIIVGVVVFAVETAAAAAVTGGEMDHQPAQNPAANYSAAIVAFANAIAVAENSNPQYNNPGDLVAKGIGWQGPVFGAGIAVFPTQDEGWNRLYYQLQLIVNGQSRVYSIDNDTIQSMANKWTTSNPGSWAVTVAQQLGVTVSTPLNEVLV